MAKWEYILVALADDYSGQAWINGFTYKENSTTLTELGEAGWELITVYEHMVIFKRPIVDNGEWVWWEKEFEELKNAYKGKKITLTAEKLDD